MTTDRGQDHPLRPCTREAAAPFASRRERLCSRGSAREARSSSERPSMASLIAEGVPRVISTARSMTASALQAAAPAAARLLVAWAAELDGPSAVQADGSPQQVHGAGRAGALAACPFPANLEAVGQQTVNPASHIMFPAAQRSAERQGSAAPSRQIVPVVSEHGRPPPVGGCDLAGQPALDEHDEVRHSPRLRVRRRVTALAARRPTRSPTRREPR